MLCSFETDRLQIGNLELTDAVFDNIASMMTAPVTKSLPPSWQGEYSPERAKSWSAECVESGTTLLSIRRKEGVTHTLTGLVILFPEVHADDSNAVDLRLGYLLSEQSWGQGFASEVVAGLVQWCRSRGSGRSSSDPGPEVKRVLGGVALDNPASKRVLLKAGFVLLKEEGEEGSGADEETFELQL